MSKSDKYESLYTTCEIVNNTQGQKTNLTIVAKDKTIGTSETNDMEDNTSPIIW